MTFGPWEKRQLPARQGKGPSQREGTEMTAQRPRGPPKVRKLHLPMLMWVITSPGAVTCPTHSLCFAGHVKRPWGQTAVTGKLSRFTANFCTVDPSLP